MVDVNRLNQDLFRQLASFAMGPINTRGTRRPSDYAIALQIMQNQPVDFSGTWSPSLGGVVPEKKDKDKGPGVFGHIIDYLLRPMYASASAFKASGGLSSGIGMLYNLATGDFKDVPERSIEGFKGGLRGLTGKEKTTYSQMIRENEDLPKWMRTGISGFTTGLAADIAGDPLTYIPIVGPAKALGRVGFSVAGKEVPYALLPKATKKAIKAAKVGSPKPTTFPVSPVLPSNKTPKAFQFLTRAAAESESLPKSFRVTFPQTVKMPGEAGEFLKTLSHAPGEAVPLPELVTNSEKSALPAIAQALKDAPIVNVALEQGAREAAVAEHTLSAQQAALHAKTFNQEAKQVLKAAEVSPAAEKTYDNLMDAITFKSRGPIQNAIDRNANKLAVAITPQTQKAFRSSKGQFLKQGTLLPTVAKKGTPRLGRTDKSKRIFSFDFGLYAAGQASLAKARNAQKAIIETPAPKVAPKQPELTRTLPKGTHTFTGSFAPKPKPKAPKNIFGPVNTAVSNAIRQNSGIQITKLHPGETISERSTVHGIMSRFATWMGQKDLRPLVLDHQASALARAGQLREAMEDAFKGFSEQEALEAWDLARKAKPYDLASTPEVAKLADLLTGQMEQYFRSRAIPENLAKANSAAMRSGMTLKDINATLGRFNIPFRFTAGEAIDPVTHSPISYSKGTNWLISWETHAPKNVTDLKKFLFGLQAAAQQTMASYAFLDDVAYRMGSRSKTALKNVKVAHPRLVDYYFDKDVADQLSTAIKTMDEFYNPKSPAARFVRQAISMWKTGVTIYSPRHHIANAIGDTFLMWMAGVNDPRVFSKAAKVLFANKGHYKDLATVEQLVGIDAMKNALAKPGTIVAKNKSGAGLSAQQVYIAMFNHGLLQKSAVVEDIVREGLPLSGRLAKPLGGKVHGFASKTAETREHYIKIAHFIGAFEKSRGKDLPAIIEEVAHEVRKWHPDGLDLTKTEQAIRTLIIPFYSWMRKSTPLVIEGAFMNPNKAFTAYAKTNYNLQSVLGIEGVTPSNPYPSDQLFPSWLKDDNTPVLGKVGMPGLAGFIGGLTRQGVDENGNPLNGYALGMPTNPVQDFFTQFGGFRNFSETKDAALSTLNPMLRIPLELQQGRELYTQIPLKDRHTDYLTNQIPIINQVARMTNVGPFGPTGRADKYGYGNKEAFLNWALGVNLLGSGPYIKSAEFELLPEKREENKRIREFSADIGYPLKDKGRIPQWIRDLYNQRQAQQGSR